MVSTAVINFVVIVAAVAIVESVPCRNITGSAGLTADSKTAALRSVESAGNAADGQQLLNDAQDAINRLMPQIREMAAAVAGIVPAAGLHATGENGHVHGPSCRGNLTAGNL